MPNKLANVADVLIGVIFVLIILIIQISCDAKNLVSESNIPISKKYLNKFVISYINAHKSKNFDQYVNLLHPNELAYYKKLKLMSFLKKTFNENANYYSNISKKQILNTVFIETTSTMKPKNKIIELTGKRISIKKKLNWVKLGFKNGDGESIGFYFFIIYDDELKHVCIVNEDPLLQGICPSQKVP